MAQIPLSLDPNNAGGGAAPEKTPVMGYCAVGFGLLGILVSFIFTPLGLICSILALFMGQAVWGFIGILLFIAGVVTSPILMGLVGLGAAFTFFDFDLFLDLFRMIFGDPTGTKEV